MEGEIWEHRKSVTWKYLHFATKDVCNTLQRLHPTFPRDVQASNLHCSLRLDPANPCQIEFTIAIPKQDPFVCLVPVSSLVNGTLETDLMNLHQSQECKEPTPTQETLERNLLALLLAKYPVT